MNYNKFEIKKGTFILFKDTVIVAPKDTVLYLPDTIRIDVKYDITHDNEIRSELFYDSLKVISNRNRFTREIYQLLFTSPTKNKTPENLTLEKNENSFLSFQGKTIRNIRIKKVDVFGCLVDDTLKMPQSWIEKTGNNIHINSRNKVIRSNLLFKSGDKVDPYLMADNEVVLRNLPFIDDARILIISSVLIKDVVDVLVITKDVWSIGLSGSAGSLEDYTLNLYDANFLGFGRRVDNTFFIEPTKEKKLGYKGRYKADNLYGTFISAELQYTSTNDEETEEINLLRNFISNKINSGGGLHLVKSSKLEYSVINNQLIPVQTEKNVQDLWLGRAINFKGIKTDNLLPRKVILSARLIRTEFTNRPDVSENNNKKYWNSTLFLGNLSFSKQNYYKTKMIYSFDRIEDIPYGGKLNFTIGQEFNEFYNRYYWGIGLYKAIINNNVGYFFAGFNFGSFLHNKKNEDGILQSELSYFSNLFSIKNYRLRQFIKLKYTSGIYRSLDSININRNNGIRGFNSDELYGTKRLTISTETVVFTPWFFYGFRFATYGFADFGFIGVKNAIFSNSLYSGFGLGIRIKNENLVFHTLEIRFAFYPKVPTGSKYWNWDISGEKKLNLRDFEGKVPAVLLFE